MLRVFAMIEDKRACQSSAITRIRPALLTALVAIFVGLLIGWLVTNPGLSLSTLCLVAGAALIFLWLLQYATIPAFSLGKVSCYLAILTGFLGVALFPIDLGVLTLFPYRILLLFLWLLFGMHLLTEGKTVLSQRQIRWYLTFLVFWLGYAVLSLAWATSANSAIRHLIFLFMGVSVIFFSLYYFRDEQDLRKLYWLWLSVFGCLLLLGFWEHLTGQHLLMSGYYSETRARFMFRPTGVFRNPNDYATFLALSIPFSLSLLRYGRKGWSRLLGLGSAIGAFYLIVATGSRANMLAVLLELAFLSLFLMNLKQKARLVVVTAVCACLLLFFLPGPVQSSFSEVLESLSSITTQAELKTGSVAIRTNLVRNGLWFLYSTAGFGVGAGNAEYWMANFARYETRGILNPHNWWLEILTEYGIFVFVGYLIFYLGLIWSLWKARRKMRKREERMIWEALLVSLVGFFFAGISSSSVMAFTPQWLLFAFALVFLNYIRSCKREACA